MVTYIFSGKVEPERASVSISPLSIRIEAIDAGFSGGAIVSINSSQVSIKLDTTSEGVSLATMKNYVEQFVRATVDSYGYLSGRGYDVEITSAIQPDGTQTVFGVGIPELEESRHERPLSFQELLEAVGKSPYLHQALADLREAIRSPLDTGFFCYRAVECLRQHFKKDEDGDQDGPSWERLRQNLRIDLSWLNRMKDAAKEPRHGKFPYISGTDSVEVMQHAWRVVDRFCVYASKDFQALPESDFDILREV